MRGLPRINRRLALIGGGLGLLASGGAAFTFRKGHRIVCPNAVMSPPKPEYALSLRVLQEQIARCSPTGACPVDLKNLYGLTAIGGFVIDAKNKDMVLFGEKKVGEAALDVDDLVVALRNLNHLYVTEQDGQRYFSYPTISIDPTSESLRQWAQLGRELTAANDKDIDTIIHRWAAACADPQNVNVTGVPRNSRFARVMFEADYKLKQITNGDLDLQTSGVTSLMQLWVDSAITKANQKQSVDLDLTSRFWFSAGDSSYSAGHTTAALTQVDVRLLTEAELATDAGQLKGTGKAEELSEQFACQVSSRFSSVAEHDPVYRHLQNLFRWMALVRIMLDEQAAEKAGLDLAVLLERYAPAETDVPTMIPGRPAVGRHDDQQYSIRVPSCGGVDVKFEKESVSRNADFFNEVDEQVGSRVLAARPPTMAGAVWRVA